MTVVEICSGDFTFHGVLEMDRAPETCAAFLNLLPYRQHVIHSRWSGEAVWIPLGNFDLGVGLENHTSHASRGDILFYPGGISETEFLFVYGSSIFASKMGQLAGNHFFTMTHGDELLEGFGKKVLWEGAQPVEFRLKQ
jgi:hypothetical protein